MKKESQQSRDQWWIWSREAMKGLHQHYLLLHQKARGKPDTKVKVLWVRKLRSTIERRDPVVCSQGAHRPVVLIMKFGLLKSGHLMNWWMIERRDPLIAHNERLNHVSLVTARTSFWKKMQITTERRDPLFALYERINSLLKTMRQDQDCR